jgi:hypothetical protein
METVLVILEETSTAFVLLREIHGFLAALLGMVCFGIGVVIWPIVMSALRSRDVL